EFGLSTGYSDHSAGIAVALAAASRGAVMIEKHFTLDKNMSGPDHKASLDPDEFKVMVTHIREIERCLGSFEKKPTKSELNTRKVARQSLIAATSIAKGVTFNESSLSTRRAGEGISPMRFWEFFGTKASKDYAADELIEES